MSAMKNILEIVWHMWLFLACVIAAFIFTGGVGYAIEIGSWYTAAIFLVAAIPFLHVVITPFVYAIATIITKIRLWKSS